MEFNKLTDRQLLEKQTQYLRSINNNVRFFFWLTIIGGLITYVILSKQ